MRGATLYSPGDIRAEERPDASIDAPTDAIIRARYLRVRFRPVALPRQRSRRVDERRAIKTLLRP
jgi:hypothetical protein